jgi:AcrR family transcriptional regulator
VSDERLRELERRWQETGAVGDEIALLRERVKVGDLEPEKLDLAAWLGNEAALALTERAPVQDLEELLRQFEEWEDDEVCRRFMFAAGRSLMRATPRLRDVFAAAEEWFLGAQRVEVLKSLITRFDAGARGDPAGEFLVCLMYGGYGYPRLFFDSNPIPRVALQRALRDELIPWALGYGNPVWS